LAFAASGWVGGRADHATSLTTYASPSETRAVRAVLRSPSGPKSLGSAPDSSHGVHSKMPLHRYKSCASTPGEPKPAFGLELPSSRLVPPLSFHPTPTVSSAQDPAGLLHPATGHGVRHVSGLPPRCRDASPFPVAPTLRSFSLLDSLPASPRFVPSRRWVPVSRRRRVALPRPCCVFPPVPRPQGFAPSKSPLQAGWRCRQSLLDAPLGFSSFK